MKHKFCESMLEIYIYLYGKRLHDKWRTAAKGKSDLVTKNQTFHQLAKLYAIRSARGISVLIIWKERMCIVAQKEKTKKALLKSQGIEQGQKWT